MKLNYVTNPDGTLRNVTSGVAPHTIDLIDQVWALMAEANHHDEHASQQPGYLYGDLHATLGNLLRRCYGADAGLVYDVMLDSGEHVSYAVAYIIAARVPDPCSECGSLVYHNEVLQQAASGQIELDLTPTHSCTLERALA